MATITGLTAERMIEIEDGSIVDGDVVAGNLILTKHDGSLINAGSVIGPTGPEGPVGSDMEVITAQPVYDVGVIDQIRAGRQFTPTDFGDLSLNPPLGLWNFGNVSDSTGLVDSSGYGRNLLNKGAVSLSVGINGVANTSAIFDGSSAKALYIADTGGADPFRIRTGSFGCWYRNARRNSNQGVMSKWGSAGQQSWLLEGYNTNVIRGYISNDGTASSVVIGTSDVNDDRWHFVVVTFDGTLISLYVDGVLESTTALGALIFPSTAPLNIGGRAADASTANASPFFGLADEAFVTSDILTVDQILNLYCAKVEHGLGEVPERVTLHLRRRRKGPSLVTGDFSTSPLRLYNFSAGSLVNEGSQGATYNLTATGSPVSVAGADGTPGNAYDFSGSGQYLRCADTGLPAGTNYLCYGCWVKTNNAGAGPFYIFTYGTTNASNDVRLYLVNGLPTSGNGIDSMAGTVSIADGKWHFIVVLQDAASIDGNDRKLYVDGKLVATSTTLASITLGGANKFVIGASLAAATPFPGQIDGVFVSDVNVSFDKMMKLYLKGAQALPPASMNPENRIRAMLTDYLLVSFKDIDGSTLIGPNQVDIKVNA